jgi:hypothetical protein
MCEALDLIPSTNKRGEGRGREMRERREGGPNNVYTYE